MLDIYFMWVLCLKSRKDHTEKKHESLKRRDDEEEDDDDSKKCVGPKQGA